MDSTAVSHSPTELCCNIKSKKESGKRCTNPATHGKYCGLHYKHPRPFDFFSDEESIAARVKTRHHAPVSKETAAEAASKIVRWYRIRSGIQAFQTCGPAVFLRDVCTNDCDFFSTDALDSIERAMFFSFRDTDGHVYGFDIRSIHTLIHKARLRAEGALNPFTRAPISIHVCRKVQARIEWLGARGLPTEWEPLAPPTPEQQWRMRVVDVFSIIDELNYYSSPDWFIDLDHPRQRRFYNELYQIWTHRAGLSMSQKRTIVPDFHRTLFRYPPWSAGTLPTDALRKLNLQSVRTLITSAADKNDRILGAMYVMTALTVVSEGARTAYPWLYESVDAALHEEPAMVAPPPPLFAAAAGGAGAVAGGISTSRFTIATLLGNAWLSNIFAVPDLTFRMPRAAAPAAMAEEENEEE